MIRETKKILHCHEAVTDFYLLFKYFVHLAIALETPVYPEHLLRPTTLLMYKGCIVLSNILNYICNLT